MNIETIRLSDSNHFEFLNILEKELNEVFDKEILENYGRKYPWSLLSLIENNLVDSYQLIYVDKKFWGGSGGRIINWNNKKVYQAGFRGFAKTRLIQTGLGASSLMHEYNTKHQIERAIINKCSSVILSFNDHNKKLFEITYKYHLPKIFGKKAFVPLAEKTPFNGVEQWILMMSL